MKFDFKKHECIIWGIFSILVLTICIFGMFATKESYQETRSSFLRMDIKNFEGKVNSTIKTYESFSNYIYDEIQDDEKILSIVSRANIADEKEKEKLRQELLALLNARYENMRKHEFRQLHFHLPNTESFLRVHCPEKYGDLLIDVRESVRLVNENEEYISGFEEGRIFNGYRYVYPLKYKGEHIGSVEVSISIASVLEVLSNLYPDSDFNFIISKSIVEDKVFKSQLDNYADSLISEHYYIDKEVKNVLDKYNTMMPDEKNSFMDCIKSSFANKLTGESFVETCRYNDLDYMFKFISVKNFKKEHVAYLISMRKGEKYRNLDRYMQIQIVLIAVLAIFLIIVGYTFARNNRRLRKNSETDNLTKLYNRNKFYNIAEKELMRCQRYGYMSSLIMMDIDHFKNINDSYGHEVGDKVLKDLSKLVLGNIRSSDIFARWGGEEFVIFLPHTDRNKSFEMAEKIRTLVDETKDGYFKDVTVSIGVSSVDTENNNIDFAISQADEAMYRAKEKGRNQVCCKD